MTIVVVVPLPLRKFTGGERRVEVEGAATIGQLIDVLEEAYPGIKSRLRDKDTGEPLPYINYFINEQNARSQGDEEASIKDGDEVAIIPAIAGGSSEVEKNNIYKNLAKTVGNTPLVYLDNLGSGLPARLAAKVESFNPLSSVKDRAALGMIKEAEESGKIGPGSVLVEATSGNTGIALAFIAAARGYSLILTMPETMSMERRALLKALGAETILTPAAEGMAGALASAKEKAAAIPASFIPSQFDNPANPRFHYDSTGPEIWRDTGGQVDFLVAGVGTGGTISGAGRFLKEKKDTVKIVAVEPTESPVLSGGKPGPHKIQGIGAGFVPGNLDESVLDAVEQVSGGEAAAFAQRLAREEGILAGISSGAAVAAAYAVASRRENEGSLVVVVLPDTGERYLSTGLF